MLNFKNLKQLEQTLKTNEDCIKYYEAIRWKEGIYCPHCNHEKHYKLKKAFSYRCANKECKKTFNCLTGTIFENTKIGLTLWFTAIYIAASHKKGISSLQLSRDLGITQKTAWFVLHRIREMLKEKEPVMLQNEVEIDEVYIGGKNKNRHNNKKVKESQGRSTKDKTPVLGILERGGKIVVAPVENTSSKALTPIMSETVKEGSTVYTDEWRGYSKLKGKYTHQIVRHALGEYVIGACHTNTVEGFWSLLKRGVYGIYHQVSRKHLGRYCNEFAFRYNTRKLNEEGRFDFALAYAGRRLKYSDLIK